MHPGQRAGWFAASPQVDSSQFPATMPSRSGRSRECKPVAAATLVPPTQPLGAQSAAPTSAANPKARWPAPVSRRIRASTASAWWFMRTPALPAALPRAKPPRPTSPLFRFMAARTRWAAAASTSRRFPRSFPSLPRPSRLPRNRRSAAPCGRTRSPGPASSPAPRPAPRARPPASPPPIGQG